MRLIERFGLHPLKDNTVRKTERGDFGFNQVMGNGGNMCPPHPPVTFTASEWSLGSTSWSHGSTSLCFFGALD